MVALPIINSVTSSAVLGAITTKLIDSIISSRINQRQEKRKWIRNTKLDLFSQLSEEILSIDFNDIKKNHNMIKKISFKIILLMEDEKFKTKLENYLFLLEEYKSLTYDINLNQINLELLNLLSNHMKKL
jgi:hypothetical protein